MVKKATEKIGSTGMVREVGVDNILGKLESLEKRFLWHKDSHAPKVTERPALGKKYKTVDSLFSEFGDLLNWRNVVAVSVGKKISECIALMDTSERFWEVGKAEVISILEECIGVLNGEEGAYTEEDEQVEGRVPVGKKGGK